METNLRSEIFQILNIFRFFRKCSRFFRFWEFQGKFVLSTPSCLKVTFVVHWCIWDLRTEICDFSDFQFFFVNIFEIFRFSRKFCFEYSFVSKSHLCWYSCLSYYYICFFLLCALMLTFWKIASSCDEMFWNILRNVTFLCRKS